MADKLVVILNMCNISLNGTLAKSWAGRNWVHFSVPAQPRVGF